MRAIETAFPAERRSLRSQCDGLASLPQDRLSQLTAALRAIELPGTLQHIDWVNDPTTLITEMTAWLWTSGQIDRCRNASAALLAAVPLQAEHPHRLRMVLYGRDANTSHTPTLNRLRRQGVTFTHLDTDLTC